ncbi:hypothetical protein AMJ57_01640 [Parcubacteria bacterium SG8_24]|nr:MAG: hypothetical protein AMJ57_01640 [Parcubacteria bacterium SG8_24]
MLKKTLFIVGSLTVSCLLVYGLVVGLSGRPSWEIDGPSDFLEEATLSVRPTAVAGQFYPAGKEELEATVHALLEEAEIPDLEGRVRMAIVPHAGYDFSGGIAARAFRALEGSGYRRVVIIGKSHHARFDGVAADPHDLWDTPLGQVRIDQGFIDRLRRETTAVAFDAAVHAPEHSLEVLLPLMVATFGTEVEVVPLLFGSDDHSLAVRLADALDRTIDRETLVLISTDLSHYPTYEDARRYDSQVIEAMATVDEARFRGVLQELTHSADDPPATFACAAVAVSSGLILAEKMGLRADILGYLNSGDRYPEMRDRVVGYGTVVFVETEVAAAVPADGGPLDDEARRAALDLARRTLMAAFSGEEYLPGLVPDRLMGRQGVFVTLRKSGELRGCIGIFESDETLVENIQQMSLAAAFHDQRFPPLDAGELDSIEIEISVLSPLRRIGDPDLIEVGMHGVQLRRDGRSGVFLPQVATEQGWGKEAYLSNLCSGKAGLEPDCWRDPRTELWIFTAEVFSENHP